MSYIINGEETSISDVIETDTQIQLTKEYINCLDTDIEFTKNILKKEDIGKVIFIIKI